MTKFIETSIQQVRPWKNGKGSDLVLEQEQDTYYYHGDMNIPMGACLKFELQPGEGEHKGKTEIIGFKKLKENFVVPPGAKPVEVVKEDRLPIKPFSGQVPPNLEGAPQQGRIVSLPMEGFRNIIRNEISLIRNEGSINDIRAKTLTAATKIYCSLSKFEKDCDAAAHDVIKIAYVLEGYLK